ncbi:MAG TPA: hypothetical protein VJO33_06685, partial [Gemmatimonadaceae bacterium]|nr:hypothetical protein [Gemmatimonadaceae bacterium]
MPHRPSAAAEARERIAQLDGRASPNGRAVEESNTKSTPRTDEMAPVQSWPDLPSEEAFAGLAGSIVDAIGPHSEADPVALLSQTLLMFGNVVGRGPYFITDGARQHLNENLVLVGATSIGRKGTSSGQIRGLFREADAVWTTNQIRPGLSSGEGLIYAVRDACAGGKEDAGATDARLLVLEAEFANTLQVKRRETNTLTAVLRSAWDGDPLHTLTKNSPLRATAAHISVIGHITTDELQRLLQQGDAANGWLNRFMLI